MSIFSKIGKAVGGIFKKKKKNTPALANAVALATGSITGVFAPATKPPQKGKSLLDWFTSLPDTLNGIGSSISNLKDGLAKPIDLNNFIKLPTVELEASKKQNTILIAGIAIIAALFIFKRKG